MDDGGDMETTMFFTSNSGDSLIIDKKETMKADIDFYYIWIIMFTLFIIVATGIVIKFWLYHFGRLRGALESGNLSPPATIAQKVGSISTNRKDSTVEMVEKALENEEKHQEEDLPKDKTAMNENASTEL